MSGGAAHPPSVTRVSLVATKRPCREHSAVTSSTPPAGSSPVAPCPSPKPSPRRLANVRAVLTGRKKLRTRREGKVVGIRWPSTLRGGTRFSGGVRTAGGQKEEEKLPVCVRGWR